MTKIPTEIIKLAIEGGWTEKGTVTVHDTWVEIDHGPSVTQMELSSVALDREFWVALGKKLGWGKHDRDVDALRCLRCGAADTYIEEHQDEICGLDFRCYAREFCECVLSGQDPTEWWAELIANK